MKGRFSATNVVTKEIRRELGTLNINVDVKPQTTDGSYFIGKFLRSDS